MVVVQQQRLLPLLHNTDYVQMSLYPTSMEIAQLFDSGSPTKGGLLLDFGFNLCFRWGLEHKVWPKESCQKISQSSLLARMQLFSETF